MLSYIADFVFLVSPSYLANIADFFLFFRLRVVSNFGNGDCRAGEKHTRNFEETRREGASPRYFERARVCVFRPPHNPSLKLETTRSLSVSPSFPLFTNVVVLHVVVLFSFYFLLFACPRLLLM